MLFVFDCAYRLLPSRGRGLIPPFYSPALPTGVRVPCPYGPFFSFQLPGVVVGYFHIGPAPLGLIVTVLTPPPS